LSQQCVQIEFVEEIVRLAPAGLLLHHFHICSPKAEEEEKRRKLRGGGRGRKAGQNED